MRRLLRLLGSVLGMLGVAFVALQLFRHWDQVDPGRLSVYAWSLVALLAAVSAAANLMLAMAWGHLLAFVGIDVSRSWAVRTYGLSQIAKYVPGNVFHLAGRQALGMAAGLPTAALLKSLIWELGLIAATGCLFGLLILPLLAAGWPVGASLLAFAAAAALMVAMASQWLAPSVGAALLWHIAFLLVSGAVFVGAMALSAPSPWSLGLVMTVAGAYVVAWLIGLITPGAPGGVGVRELALLYLLGSQFAQADLLIAVAFAVGLLLCLVVNGALPSAAIPTLGQAVWTAGFSQSFVNESLLTIYARNIGAPQPAAIAFGLAGAWPTAGFMRLFLPRSAAAQRHLLGGAGLILAHVAVAVIAVFMDGYSFMMFAAGGGILGVWLAVAEPRRRRWLVTVGLPGHALALGIAYGLYGLYLGKPQFEPAHLDFFRGWGVDLVFLVVPSQGVLWLPDLLGWSVRRTAAEYFGDSSVWRTTFSLPLIAAAVWAAFRVSGSRHVVTGLVLVGAFGFYMALGPSLKINSTKPEGQPLGPTMEAQYAVAPTGSGLLSAHLPGFNNMRASYRWQALGAFAAWALLLLAMSRREARLRSTAAAMFCVVVVFNLPDLPQKLRADSHARNTFIRIDTELAQNLGEVVRPRERVAFLPWQNDFLATYLAASLDAVAFNIGGDKNLAEARKHWPPTMHGFPRAYVDESFSNRVLLLLARAEADVVILSYLDMGRSAFEWPPRLVFQDALQPAIDELQSSGYVDVEGRELYAVVRLQPEFARQAGHDDLTTRMAIELCLPPKCLQRQRLGASDHSLVGHLQDGVLHSTGAGGFVHYGPYVPMDAGDYVLTIHGAAQRADSSWVDLVSGTGAVRHSHHELVAETGDAVLLQARVSLDSPVHDLEVRLYVGADDQIAMSGYTLAPAGATNAQPR